MTTSLSNGRIPLNAGAGDQRHSPTPTPIHVTFKGKNRPLWSSPAARKRNKEMGEDLRRTRKQVKKIQ